MQPHWVGDLTLSARVSTASTRGALRLELIEGETSNRCDIDVATGEAVATRDEAVLGRGKTLFRGPGVHDLVFANVDNRLTLLVDGRPAFGDGLTYDDDPQTHPLPTVEDLTPARLAAKDAKIVVSDLVLKRDIYYTLYPGQPDYRGSYNFQMPGNPAALFDMLANPERVAGFGQLGFADYPIGKDRFMMMGDNSPRSHDSRRWSDIDQFVAGDATNGFPDRGWDTIGRNTYEVPRPMITGKAFCIYWPHGKPFWPNLRITQDFRIPFRPYFERMKLIH
jgi:signal peptidase I